MKRTRIEDMKIGDTIDLNNQDCNTNGSMKNIGIISFVSNDNKIKPKVTYFDEREK